LQAPIAVAGTAKKACTRATRKDIPPILHTVNGKAVDATQVGEISKHLARAEETKSKAQTSALRRSTRTKKRSDKVEDNRQIEAELVLTAALTVASRAAGHRRQNFHSTQLKEAQFRVIW
jgi:hypothetical protein